MSSPQIIDLVFKSRGNLLKMLAYRGCDVKEYQNYTKDEIAALLTNHMQGKYTSSEEKGPLDIIVEQKNSATGKKDGSRIMVKYRMDQRMMKKDTIIKQAAAIFEHHDLDKEKDTLIILNQNAVFLKPGSKEDSVQTVVNRCYLSGMFIQIYGLENFNINIAEHQLVPKHTLLTDKQIQEVVDKYKSGADQLPKIKREDPMAKYVGARPGNVIKIDTFNPTNGTEPLYRYVTMQD